MNQITTISFFRFSGVRNQFWALKMMQFAHERLSGIAGQEFYKLMGSGRGIGFSPFPDWSTYCLLQVWKNERDAEDFFTNSSLMAEYRTQSEEQWILFMRNIKAHGEWSGNNPFIPGKQLDPNNKYVAVLTRATIKWNKLIQFWRYVPTSQKPLYNMPGLLFQKGIGELPVIQMATFSLWKDVEAVRRYAYQSSEHQKAISMTREHNWYKEELFSRFQPYRSLGSWHGKNLL